MLAFVFQHPVQSSSAMQSRSSSADLTRETLASIHLRAKAKIKPPKPIRQSTIPVTESDKFLNAGTYIGPLKKKGRPKASGTENKTNAATNAVASGSGSSTQPKDVIVIDGSDSEGTLSAPTNSDFAKSKSTNAKPSAKPISKRRTDQSIPAYTTEPLVNKSSNAATVATPVQVKTEPQDGPTVLDILALLSSTSSADSSSQNAAILTALSTIDSTTESGNASENTTPNPYLVSALRQLLAVYAQSAAPMIPEATAPEIVKHPQLSPSHSQEIIMVDKENVNPVIHHKRHDDVKGAKSVMETMAHTVSSSPGTSQKSLHSLGRRSSRSNELEKMSPTGSASSLGAEKLARKRTLSDFMDEREKGKTKGKGKEREKGEKPDGDRKSNSQRSQKTPVVDSLRHYPHILASNQPRVEQPTNYYRMPLESMTSPARPRPDFDDFSQDEEQKDISLPAPSISENLRQCRTPSPRPPPLSRVSASSPVRGPQYEARRKYVVPEWARTNTSTKPRLSEEAQRALQQAEERKRQERSAARKKLPSVQAKLKNKETLCPSKPGYTNSNPVKPLAPPPPPKESRGPITVNDKPMFAAANINFPFNPPSRPSSPTPQTTNPLVNQFPRTPKTPTRERRVLEATPGRENESLFTPMGSGSLFGSARSFTLHTPLAPSVLTSPLGNRKKAKISPMRSTLTGKGFEIAKWTNSSSSAPNSSDSKDTEEDSLKKALDQELDQELEDALEDLNCPPSSLPIASSDMDADSSSYTVSGTDTTIQSFDQDFPVKQHWAGLPPSSPPAPSSPMLLPEADQSDDEMDDLPIATSDSETDTDMQACENDTPSPAVFSPQTPDDDSSTENNGLSLFTFVDQTVVNMDSMATSDLFDQFTNLNDHSDALAGIGNAGLNPATENFFQNGLEEMDFTEFWATFIPMVDDNTRISQEQAAAAFFDESQNNSLLSFGEVDHAKLADDMQTLLSGCLM